MSAGRPLPDRDRMARFLAEAEELRPELHRYCARLMGSVIDGEDVVQDTLVRAFVALGRTSRRRRRFDPGCSGSPTIAPST